MLSLTALACGEPSARVLVAWVSADRGTEVNHVQIYDDGRRYVVPWATNIPGSRTEQLRLDVDDRGRGIALSGPGETLYQSLRDRRLGITSEGRSEFQPEVAFTRNADAVVRSFKPDAFGTAIVILPTTSEFAMTQFELRPPAPVSPESAWTMMSAANAPVFFWIEQGMSPSRAEGVVQAVGYPSALGEVLPVSEPVILATGVLHGRGLVGSERPARISGDKWCAGRTCASPSGRVLSTMMPDEPCTLRVWSWVGARDVDVNVQAERLVLPRSCRESDDPWLVAQIADDVFVLDDDDRVYVADVTAGSMQAVPKLDGDGFTEMMVRDRGRVVLLVTTTGQVVRVDGSGPRLLATEQTYCSSRDTLNASPSGNWVVQSCGQGSFADAFSPVPEVGSVVRVSSLGLERYFGIPMRTLGIDDEGNVLLHSYRGTDTHRVPRSLFVLTGDGQLAKVDSLDPTPTPVIVSSETTGHFASSTID